MSFHAIDKQRGLLARSALACIRMCCFIFLVITHSTHLLVQKMFWETGNYSFKHSPNCLVSRVERDSLDHTKHRLICGIINWFLNPTLYAYFTYAYRSNAEIIHLPVLFSFQQVFLGRNQQPEHNMVKWVSWIFTISSGLLRSSPAFSVAPHVSSWSDFIRVTGCASPQ